MTGAEFAKGGGGPSVGEAVPNQAPQNVNLDVVVKGNGFDNGSTVRFLLAGQNSSAIVTESTTFVDRKNLRANITIPLEADVSLYDVEVRTSRGKNGIGSELFAVTPEGDSPPGGDFVPADFPAALIGGGQNAMIAEPHDQTMKSGNSSKRIGGFNPNYVVALNFLNTSAAGWVGVCSVDSRGQTPGTWEDDLFATLVGDPMTRYTIVRVTRRSIGKAHRDHELQALPEPGIQVRVVGSPTVEFVQDPVLGGESGTYRYTGGTVTIRNFNLPTANHFQAMDCPNLDTVEVFLDFSAR